jgi:hypothetical protein
MLAFVPRSPITYDDNEGEINRVRVELRDAIDRRDYVAANHWQQELDYFLNVRDYLEKQANQRDKNVELDRLELQRQREEEDLKARMNQQLQRVLAAYRERLDEMERRHGAELARLDRRYSDPRFGALRQSPSINCLLRAETFYSGQRNYKVALAFKDQVIARTDQEIDRTENLADTEVQSKINLLVRRHELEKRGFRERLENEKNRLNRETANELLVLRNKYGKLRRRVLGIGEIDPLPESARREGRGVYQVLERRFEPMLSSAETLSYTPVAPETPRTARGSSSSQYSIGSGTAPASARNPRVQRALEASLTRKELARPL